MGILHSSCRFFGCKTANEEEEWPIYPYPLHYHYNGGSEGFSSACSSILECFGLARGRRRAENDVVPIQNRSSREPLLVSVSDKGRSQSSYQPEKKQRDHPDVVLSITRATYKSSPTVSERTDVIRNVSISDVTRNIPTSSFSSTAPRNGPIKKADGEEKKLPSSTVCVRKDAPRNVSMKKADREEEKKELASSSIVSIGKDAPRYVLVLGTKKADRDEEEEEEEKVRCKELSTVSVAPRNVSVKKADRELKKELPSSSTVSIRKDAPRYVIVGTKKAEEKKELTSSSTVSVGKDAPSYAIVGMKKADPEDEKKESCKVLTSSSTVSVNVPFLEERMWKKKTDPEEENNNKKKNRRRKKKVSLIKSQNRGSREPLLVSDKGGSQSSYQPEKKQRDHPDVGITRATYKSSPTGKDAPRNVPTSSSSSTVTVRKDAPRNVPMKKADQEEEKKATVSVRKDVPRNFGMKKAEREEKEKELASSSIVSVGKNAPRYVRILKADREDVIRNVSTSSSTISDVTRNVPTSSFSSTAPRNVPIKKADGEEKKLPSSTVCVREDAPRNVPMKKAADREEEKKELASSSIVCIGRDAPRYVRILGTKKADPDEEEEEEKKVRCKELFPLLREMSLKKADRELKKKELPSSSTVSIRKDAPRYVIVGAKKAEEKKELTSSSTVSVGKDAPRCAIVGMKKADPEEEKKESCKVLTSSSTVSVNVPFLEESMWKNKTDPKEENNKKNRRWKKKKVSLIKSTSTSIIIEEEKKRLIMEERWIQHYSSRHRILLVGEGDFSFSASLALAFSSASNIIATSLNSQEFLLENYSRAASNIEELRSRESKVMHEIDATEMANHPLLRHLKFDRIIFNFPYAGLANIKILPLQSQLGCHRRLVNQFLKNAREMINEDGEIHISHKTNHFHKDFMIESIASSHKLRLIEAVDFNNLQYPGYNTKCGFGGDKNFNYHPSKTFKFCINNFHHY